MKRLFNNELLSNPGSRRILLATFLTFLTLSIYFTIFTYRTLVKDHQNTALMRLFGIVNSTALLIDGDMHQTLMLKYPEKENPLPTEEDLFYKQIHALLKRNESANMLNTPIYTIIYDSLKHRYEFGVSSAEKSYFRHLYTQTPMQLTTDYDHGGMIPSYKDEFGQWLSAFAPIKNKEGKTVAILKADEKYDAFAAMVRKSVWKNIGMSLLMLTILFSALLRMLHTILTRELNDRMALQEANETNKKMSTQLSASLNELKKTDEFRKEMIANFSHDLRTPLASVSGFLELVLNELHQPLKQEDSKKYIQIAYAESQRLKRLVNELFELSKLESGQIKLNLEMFSMPELIQDVLHKYDIACKEKNITLVTEFPPGLHLLQADISWMDRLLQNLLDNAIHHCNEDGIIKLALYDSDHTQHIKISNSGIPIHKEDLPFVFDRYFKSTQRNHPESTGLGLAIVKKIIDLHHGYLLADVEEGMTVFKFSLATGNDQPA